MPTDSQPRTLLEQLIRNGSRTLDELCVDFDKLARKLDIQATLSTRQLKRWASGDVGRARPAARRVALELWGCQFEMLTAPPAGHPHDGPIQPSASEKPITQMRLHRPGFTAASLREEVAMTAEESAAFVRRPSAAITPALIEQYYADIDGLSRRYLTEPPFALFTPLAERRRQMFQLIDARPRPQYLPDLYRIAGHLSALLAHASFDMDHGDAADTHARTALLCADMCGDTQLVAYTRWVQSNVAYWRGNYRRAAQIAHTAQGETSEPDGLLRLVSQQARALAACGERQETRHALTRMADLRQSTGNEGVDSVFTFSAGKAAYYASEAQLALGSTADTHQARLDAQEAVDRLSSPAVGEPSPELVAAARLDLALAYLASRDVEAAQNGIRMVFTLASENRTLPLIKRMRGLHDVLDAPAFASTAAATQIQADIGQFCAYPATRHDLPQLPE
ncbi:MAG: hypothetical protein HOQ05_13955 [Corynebacteriales bacterium]|nr:hypothetical protein [Mycobacteriales bacterium]